MTWEIIILAAAVAAVGILVAVFGSSTLRRVRRLETGDRPLDLMRDQVDRLSLRLDNRLGEINTQLRETTGHIGDRLAAVKRDLGEVSRATDQVYESARDISRLEKLLKAPKFRGGLGELFLGELLGQILPASAYRLQHRFASGEIVDAVVTVGENMVPIDSKFPYENFRRYAGMEESKEKESFRRRFIRDVKKHIDDIARKYILPDEGTFDFALMYIQAENIYYEIIIREEDTSNESLINYALKRRVIPVSPSSFYSYLQVILLGLKGLRVEKNAARIVAVLGRLAGDLERFRQDFNVMGSHLHNARSRFEEADRKLERFEDKLKIVSAPGLEEDPPEEEAAE